VFEKRAFKRLRRAAATVQDAQNALDALAAARQLREAAEDLEIAAVIEARRRRATWTEIGSVYGTSKQAAQQRFRSAVTEHQLD
jgi:hypothetical protein